MKTSLVACLPAAWLLMGAAACQDPCEALAQRICNCKPSLVERQACVSDRISSQKGRVTITDAARSVCTAALDTCDCTALDENHVELCGFVRDPGSP